MERGVGDEEGGGGGKEEFVAPPPPPPPPDVTFGAVEIEEMEREEERQKGLMERLTQDLE
jgi:hypothetical protein